MAIPVSAFGNKDYIYNLMDAGADEGDTLVRFDDGEEVSVDTRMLIFNSILWLPYYHFKLPITKKDLENVKAILGGTFSKIQTKQYHRILNTTNLNHMDVVKVMFIVHSDLHKFIVKNLGSYQLGMSALSLARVQCNPKITAITSQVLDPMMGTEAAEIRHNNNTKEMTKIISTRGVLEEATYTIDDVIKQMEVRDKYIATISKTQGGGVTRTRHISDEKRHKVIRSPNVLIPFMECGALKENQIPQQMYCYGPRSDINDHMMRHIINESAMSGLKSPADYAVESLSAKKSSYFNKTVIKNTQYFARVLRINCSATPKMYKGDCGNRIAVPHTIHAKETKNYTDKIVFHEGRRLAVCDVSGAYSGFVSDENEVVLIVKEYDEGNDKKAYYFVPCKDGLGINVPVEQLQKDIKVSMVSPITCRYSDGVCEYCAGRNSIKPWAFHPNDTTLNLGIYAATHVGRAVSQMVLSAKHLIKTKSLTYVPPGTSSKYFMVMAGSIDIFLREKIAEQTDLRIHVPVAAFHRPLSDLQHESNHADSFSELEMMAISDKLGNKETFSVSTDRHFPFFSSAFLKHMAKNMGNIETTDDDMYIIPLKGFGAAKSIMQYTVVNDDMVAFTKSVDRFLKTRIGEYTSVSAAMQDFVKILYNKTKVNVFYAELLIKCFVADARITDIDNVEFAKMKSSIENKSVSSKMSHERLGSRDYLGDASACVVDKGVGFFDSFFGF